MKSTRILLLVLLFFPMGLVASDDQSSRKSAEGLLAPTDAEGMLSGVRAQVGEMLVAQLKKVEVPDDLKDMMARYQQRIRDLISDEMSFAKMKDSYVEVYTSVFTTEELNGFLAFYKTPVGKALAEKTPVLSKRIQELAQSRVQKLAPAIQKMTEEFISEVEKTKK